MSIQNIAQRFKLALRLNTPPHRTFTGTRRLILVYPAKTAELIAGGLDNCAVIGAK